jgi:HAMP domain-containing protein
MGRQETLAAITAKLAELPDEKLEALLGWVEQEDDPFEQRLRADVAAGKLDKLIAEAIAEDEVGETIDRKERRA